MWPELEWEQSNLRRACLSCDNRKRQIEGRFKSKNELINALRGVGFILE